MTDPIEGGLRDRMVFDSFAEMLRTSLDQLHWFDDNRWHQPINFITTPVDMDKEIPLNTLSVQAEDASDEGEAELGSNLTEDTLMVWVDLYAESAALGTHLSGDVRDILRGKVLSIDRDDPSFWVVDMREKSTPFADRTPLFLAQIESVERQRSAVPTAQRHWYSVTAHIIEDRQ